MATFRRLLKLLAPYKWKIALGFVCLLIAQPLQLAHPLFWKFVVDEVIVAESPMFFDWVGQSRLALLGVALAGMFAAYAGGVFFSAIRTWLLGVVAQRFGFDLRNMLYQRLQDQSLRFFHDRRSGDLVSRATGDVETVQDVATNGIDEIVGNILQMIIVWSIICWLSWQVAVILLVPLTAVAVMTWQFNKKIRPLYRRSRDRLGDVSAKIQENITGMDVIKAFGRADLERRRVETENRRYLETAIQAITARVKFMPTVQVVGFLSNVVMLGVGGYFILYGEFTIGGLVALRGYWWQMFSPVAALARINDMVQRSLAAGSRIFETLDEPIEIEDAPDAVALDEVDGRIAFENVTFGYVEDHDRVLTEASFDLEPGQTLGVVGPSGAGKSTLLKLVLRFYDPLAGRVLIDGHDVREVTQDSLRSHMGVVSQDSFLFAGSVRENLQFGNLDADETDMHHAAELANAHEFITDLPDGYDTLVGERGVKLSGGQKQRICIARAFLADPQILLLDEATASVEPESEAIIQAALQRLMQGRTTILVSHRLSMVRDACQILVIHKAGIAERGTHDELMTHDGWYARMYRLQTGEAELGAL